MANDEFLAELKDFLRKSYKFCFMESNRLREDSSNQSSCWGFGPTEEEERRADQLMANRIFVMPSAKCMRKFSDGSHAKKNCSNGSRTSRAGCRKDRHDER